MKTRIEKTVDGYKGLIAGIYFAACSDSWGMSLYTNHVVLFFVYRPYRIGVRFH